MPVPSTVADLSSTASSNYPSGSESIGTSLDDYLRAHASIIRQVSDAKADTSHTQASSTVTYTQGGVGAVSATVQTKLRESVSVKDFGAVGDGVADDTAAINAALAAVYSTKQALYFPAGIYLYDGGGSLGNGNIIYGDGRNATFIRCRNASPVSGYVIRAYGYGSGIRDIRFDATVEQTSGCYVWLSGPETFIEEFYMYRDFNGILMTGNVSRIRHGRFGDGATNAIRIRSEGGDNSQLIDDVLMGAQIPQVCFAGIRVRNSAALIISNTSVIQQGHGLLVDPTTATQSSNSADGSVFSLYVNNCFFDNCSENAITISPTGTGSVVRSRFSNVWMGSAAKDGIYINNAGTGLASGLHFESCHAVLNAGSGLTTGGIVSDLTINGGEFCQNNHGVYLGGTLDNVKVLAATIGAGGGLSANNLWGVAFDVSAVISNILISDNIMLSNGSGDISTVPIGTNVQVHSSGTFVPAITFATPGNLAVTYTAQSGKYYRSGNLMTVKLILVTSSFTHTTASGQFRITGLPAIAGNDWPSPGSMWIQGITKAGYTQFVPSTEVNQTYAVIRCSGSGVGTQSAQASDFPTGGTVEIRLQITYPV